VNSEPAGYQRPAAVETRDGIFYARHERRLKPTEVCPARPLESLGRWVDDLLGDTRTRRLVEQELETMLLSEDEMPTDPPPSEPPPPVPDGTGTSTKDGRRGEREAP
jgi:hypothetical protein